jgi:hypothetical protein
MALCASLVGLSQATFNITGGAYVVIDNAAKLVVENPSTTAISNTGSGGIMTESEFDQVVWMIGTNSGTFTMPFVSQATITQIPFTATISSPGTGSGVIRFSTYPGPVSDNNTYRPSDVTHMYDYNTNTINNSNHVIDRFWIIDALGYTTKPTATFAFTYRDIEHTVASNTIVEADLGAQRFNSGTNQWGDYLPQGTTNTVTNQTSGVPVSPANFFRSWTLSEITNPLAVDLTYFKATCNGEDLKFNWQTAYEADVDHFELERFNNTSFEVIAFVPSQGGVGINDYSYTSPIYRNGLFRLMEVDQNGARIEKSSLTADCSASSDVWVSFNNSTNTLNMQFNGELDSDETLEIFDASGKVVFRSTVTVQKGTNVVSVPDLDFSNGMYAVRMKNGTGLINEKIIKSN